MTTIVTRVAKGYPLTYSEMDANFINLNADKIETAAIGTTVQGYSSNLDAFATVTPTTAGLAILDDSTAADQRATLGAQATLVSGTNIKTVNGISLLGTGDLPVAVADGDKGDITVSSSGAVWSIDDNAVTPSKLSQKLTLSASIATTSGATIEFTGLPAWVTRVSVLLSGVSTTATTAPQIQLGTDASYETTGYLGSVTTNASYGGPSTTGLSIVTSVAAADILHGEATFTRLTGNTWVGRSNISFSNTGSSSFSACSKVLPDTLTRLRLFIGTGTFDAGIASILYEG